MASQALYRKWRSQDFDEIVGQEHVTVTLRNALREGRLSHAYLFAGARGTGKTSTARILAKALNCLTEDPHGRPCNQCRICTAITEGRLLDLIEIDAASNRGIDEIRDLRDKIGFRPNEARYKVYVIDEVHMLTREAFNALLKTLEEPPPHAIFVLATTEADRVPETVRSRCQRHDFRRIPTGEIVQHLIQVLQSEGCQAAPEALVAIARRSTGSMRDALSLLDQMLSYGDEVLSLALVESVLGMVDTQGIGRLVDCLAQSDAAGGLALLNQMVAGGVELGQLADQIVAYLRAVLFVRVANAADQLDLSQDMIAVVTRQAHALTPAVLLRALREFMDARALLRDQVPGAPQLPIELAFLRTALPSEPPAARGTVAEQARPAPVAAATTVAAARSEPARPAPDAPPAAVAGRESDARPQPAAPAPDAEFSKTVQASWERVLGLAGKRCGMKVQAALRAVREIEVIGDTIILQFSHAFARDLVGQGENRIQVEAVWSELLKRNVHVRCSLLGEAIAAVAPAPQPASARPESDDEMFLRGARDLGAVVKRLG